MLCSARGILLRKYLLPLSNERKVNAAKACSIRTNREAAGGGRREGRCPAWAGGCPAAPVVCGVRTNGAGADGEHRGDDMGAARCAEARTPAWPRAGGCRFRTNSRRASYAAKRGAGARGRASRSVAVGGRSDCAWRVGPPAVQTCEHTTNMCGGRTFWAGRRCLGDGVVRRSVLDRGRTMRMKATLRS